MAKEPIDPALLEAAMEFARPVIVARTAARAANLRAADLEADNARLRARVEVLEAEVAELRGVQP